MLMRAYAIVIALSATIGNDHVFFTYIIQSITFSAYNNVDAQGLNDPLMQYIEGRLAGRRIFWCPSGYGRRSDDN